MFYAFVFLGAKVGIFLIGCIGLRMVFAQFRLLLNKERLSMEC
jgi:hypothetical protein